MILNPKTSDIMNNFLGNKLPKITINIATYNESRNIGTCLSSIFCQQYPKDRLEILVVDGGSTDDTVEKARRYPVKIIFNEKRDPASGRALGLKKASGDLHIYLDADMELPAGDDWFIKMVHPLVDDTKIVGSFTRFLPRKTDPLLNRCLSYNPQQLDPMLEFLSTRISDTVIERRAGYYVCNFIPNNVPIVGVIMFRTKLLKQLFKEVTDRWGDWMWSDVDFPIMCAQKGWNKFAYVPNVGIYHYSFLNLKKIMEKKRRDVYWSYLPNLDKRSALYIDYSSKYDILKVLAWMTYANFFIPGLLRGIAESIRRKDIACMYIPILTTFLTDYVIYLFIKDKRGKMLVKNALKTLIKQG